MLGRAVGQLQFRAAYLGWVKGNSYPESYDAAGWPQFGFLSREASESTYFTERL
jgi:hypothetical protein